MGRDLVYHEWGGGIPLIQSPSKGVSGAGRAIRVGSAYSSPWDVRKCSASMAAMQPVPAAVTACR